MPDADMGVTWALALTLDELLIFYLDCSPGIGIGSRRLMPIPENVEDGVFQTSKSLGPFLSRSRS